MGAGDRREKDKNCSDGETRKGPRHETSPVYVSTDPTGPSAQERKITTEKRETKVKEPRGKKGKESVSTGVAEARKGPPSAFVNLGILRIPDGLHKDVKQRPHLAEHRCWLVPACKLKVTIDRHNTCARRGLCRPGTPGKGECNGCWDGAHQHPIASQWFPWLPRDPRYRSTEELSQQLPCCASSWVGALLRIVTWQTKNTADTEKPAGEVKPGGGRPGSKGGVWQLSNDEKLVPRFLR